MSFLLLPNMPVLELAFEQLSLGEPLKAEGRDIHCFGLAIEDQFGHACADRRRDLKARPAHAAREIEALRSRLAENGSLVERDAIPAHMDGV